MGVVMFDSVTTKERMGWPARAAVAGAAALAFAGMLAFAKVTVGDPMAGALAGMMRAPAPTQEEAEAAALAARFRVDEEIMVVAPHQPPRLAARARPARAFDAALEAPVGELAPMCPVVR